MMKNLQNMPQQMDNALKHLETALGISTATGFQNICAAVGEDYALKNIHPLAYEEIKGALELAKVPFKEVGMDGLKLMPPVNASKLRNFCEIIIFGAEYCKNTHVTEFVEAATSLALSMRKKCLDADAQRQAIGTLLMSLGGDVLSEKERGIMLKQLLPKARFVNQGVHSKGIE